MSNKNPVASFEIEYRDSAGKTTKRGIDIVSFEDISLMYVNAYCRLRKKMRSFCPERIVSCIDLSTGEPVYDITAHLKKLLRARAKGDSAPIKAVSLELTKYIDKVRLFCREILKDGVLQDSELRSLRQLFAQCPEDKTPEMDKVLEILDMAQDDGVIDETEREKLRRAVSKLTIGVAQGSEVTEGSDATEG